jgi:hypothetical protein
MVIASGASNLGLRSRQEGTSGFEISQIPSEGIQSLLKHPGLDEQVEPLPDLINRHIWDRKAYCMSVLSTETEAQDSVTGMVGRKLRVRESRVCFGNAD